MAKEIKVGGRMKVGTLKRNFQDTFGVDIRVYKGAKFADEDATLASIRSKDAKGGDFSVRGNTKVGNVEKAFKESLGIKIQIENSEGKLASDSITLSAASK